MMRLLLAGLLLLVVLPTSPRAVELGTDLPDAWRNTSPSTVPALRHVDDVYWWHGFDELGTSSEVRVFEIYRDTLIVASHFTMAGDSVVNHIASWDGSTWRPLGTGTDDVITCATVFEDRLIIGGCFNEAGGQSAWNVARWNGQYWSSMGSLNGPSDFIIYDGMLLAASWGGLFRWLEDLSREQRSWSLWSPDMEPQPHCLAEYRGDLIVGGYFERIGDDTSLRYLARWDGESWTALGDGVDAQVTALLVHDDELVVGGNFRTAGGLAANRIARWDGESWSTFGQGMEPEDPHDAIGVAALAIYEDQLYAGGQFYFAEDGQWLTCIARWDGEHWRSLGSGVDSYVLALQTYGTGLYVGGRFHEAGGVPSWHIGLWDLYLPTAAAEAPAAPSLSVYPNPFNPHATIHFHLREPGSVSLAVYDASGRLVARLVDEYRAAGSHAVTWDGCADSGRHLASGVYFARLTAEGFSAESRLVLLR